MAYQPKSKTPPSDAEFMRFTLEIERGEVGRLYIFGGPETFLLNKYVRNIADIVVPEADRDFNMVTLTGSNANPENICDAVEMLPFGVVRRMVIIRDYDMLNPPAADKKFAADFIETIPEHVCCIVVYDGAIPAAKDKKIAEAAKNRARLVSFERQGDRELERWIAARFEAAGVKCAAAQASFLLRRTEGYMQGLSVEIDKIAAYCAASGNVTDAAIAELTKPCAEAVIYELTDAMCAGQPGRALTLADTLISQKFDPLQIINSMSRVIRQLYAAKLLEGRQAAQFSLMQECGIKSGYAADKIMRNASRVRLERLRGGVTLCAKADYEQKRSNCDKRILMETTLYELCGMFT